MDGEGISITELVTPDPKTKVAKRCLKVHET